MRHVIIFFVVYAEKKYERRGSLKVGGIFSMGTILR